MLYRKYRPKNLSEVIGQKHIVSTLSGAIENNRISHAYLFSGPRGTGKTSLARILAKAINCENPKKSISCEKCSNCQLVNENGSLDIIEIDAASNTGVDNIRELKETVATPPSKLKYKVYIIDEVHMLSKGAFNALLKTLEEPPAHVVFILATTEIHKVPETILSRCQKFDFTRLSLGNILEKLEFIAKKENIKAEKEALEAIALNAEGGMRDAETLFSQIISQGEKKITLENVEALLGTSKSEVVFEIIELVVSKKSGQAIQKINKLSEDGYNLEIFLKSLINYLHQLMILKASPEMKKILEKEMSKERIKQLEDIASQAELSEIISMIELFSEAQNQKSISTIPQLPLEIAVIKATGTLPKTFKNEDLKEESNDRDDSDDKPSGDSPTEETKKEEPTTLKPEPQKIEEQAEEPKEILPEKELSPDDVRYAWNKLIVDIKPHNQSLGVLLSNCKIKEVSGSKIILATAFEFYKEKLSIPSHKLTVEEVFGKILGSKIYIEIEVEKDLFPERTRSEAQKEEDAPQENGNLLDSALEIFGGKVVKEQS